MSAASDTLALPARARTGWPRLAGLSAARHRLLLLYALAAGPLLAVFAVNAWIDRTYALAAARHQAEAVAHLGAQQGDDLAHGVANLLNTLELVPAVRNLGDDCSAVLRQAEEAHDAVEFISVLLPSGLSACTNSRVFDNAIIAATATRLHLESAIPGTTVFAGVLNGLATDRPMVMLARLLRNGPDGKPVGIMAAGINLNAFAHLPVQLSGTAPASVDVIDIASGQIVAHGNGGPLVAASVPADPHLLSAIHAMPGGSGLETGSGTRYETGFAIMPGTDMRLALAINMPATEVLATANRHLLVNALGFTGAGLAAIILAWLAADYSLLRPIHRLVAAAAAIGNGQLGVRVGTLPGAVQELGALAAKFDAMAEQLHTREERIASIAQTLAHSEEHHRLLADNVGDMIARFDRSFTLTYVSPACRDVLGREPEELVGQTLPNTIMDEDRARVQAELARPLLLGTDAACRYRAVHKTGRTVWLEACGRRLADGSGFVTVARDVSLQKALETQLEAANRQLRIQVMQDALTGIANRRRFDEMLASEFRRAQRLQEPLSLLMVDIDHFKSLNDTYGHAVGDDWLKAVANTLDRALRRPGDMVGRYGGEEFAILLPSTPRVGLLIVAERIRNAVAAITLEGRAAGAGPGDGQHRCRDPGAGHRRHGPVHAARNRRRRAVRRQEQRPELRPHRQAPPARLRRPVRALATVEVVGWNALACHERHPRQLTRPQFRRHAAPGNGKERPCSSRTQPPSSPGAHPGWVLPRRRCWPVAAPASRSSTSPPKRAKRRRARSAAASSART